MWGFFSAFSSHLHSLNYFKYQVDYWNHRLLDVRDTKINSPYLGPVLPPVAVALRLAKTGSFPFPFALYFLLFFPFPFSYLSNIVILFTRFRFAPVPTSLHLLFSVPSALLLPFSYFSPFNSSIGVCHHYQIVIRTHIWALRFPQSYQLKIVCTFLKLPKRSELILSL